MRTILMGVYLAVLLAAMLVPCKHALHMFQQNRYEVKRYAAWIRDNWKSGMRRALYPFLIIFAAGVLAFLLKFEQVLVLCTITAGILAFRLLKKEYHAEYIKPLVYTGRVKRQIAVMAVLIILILALATLHPGRIFCMLTLAFCYFGPWVLIFLVAAVTSPIERGVQRWYINDAKRMLKEHSDLIKIGITGSYGKTSTKNVIQSVVSEQFNSLMTPASYNTPMGITRTIREHLKPIHRVFVCEMGADKVGDITELMEFVKPSIGVVTSIGPQHLSTFGSQENITREKMQMIEMLPEDGLGILNIDNPLIRDYKPKNKVRIVTYGIENTEADYRAEDIVFDARGSRFTLVHGDERVPFETKLLGDLNILNILSAIICSRELGIDWLVIRKAVREMHQVEHRLELKKIRGLTFIDDAFNANPSGAGMALRVLAKMPGRRFIVTPGMIELGEQQDEINRAFGRQMLGCADEVVLVGRRQVKPIAEGVEESGFDMSHCLIVDTVKEAFDYIWKNAGPQDTILLENDLPDAFNH